MERFDKEVELLKNDQQEVDDEYDDEEEDQTDEEDNINSREHEIGFGAEAVNKGYRLSAGSSKMKKTRPS